MKSAIWAAHLAKRYRIFSAKRGGYSTLRDVISNKVSGALRSAATKVNPWAAAEPDRPDNTCWALRDVSFQINEGERVGILGFNGAGKSTLLKILSRVTHPTAGRARISGRLVSLLEVGTGFHQELTGRDNIFLNGSILGMPASEIRKKFDEIVHFAEIERFVDTPVKRYSSGMYVRLAFSVAAHLDPDILIVDEALAVGDGAFQKKCIGKLRSASESARTLMIVSHNLQAIRSLCSRAILLDQGRIIEDGPTNSVLTTYLKALQSPRDLTHAGQWDRMNSRVGRVRFVAFSGVDRNGKPQWTFRTQDNVRFRLDYQAYEDVVGLGLHIFIRSATSGDIISTVQATITEKALTAGMTGTVELCLTRIPLRPGEYAISAQLTDRVFEKVFDEIDDSTVGLPWLTIAADIDEGRQHMGYVNLPWTIDHS